MNRQRYKTITIKDKDPYSFNSRVNEVVNKYFADQILHIDTGMFRDGTDSNGNYEVVYYAIIIAENIDEE